ncbi:MAG: hypothetical protein ACLUDU_07635 [Butyricimonas faecihominis]
MREDNFIEWRILAGKLPGSFKQEEQEFQAWYVEHTTSDISNGLGSCGIGGRGRMIGCGGNGY